MLKIETKGKIPAHFNLSEEQMSDIVSNILQTFSVTTNSIVEVLFVSKQQMRLLNLQHRNIDKATDILSFPVDQFKIDSKFSILGTIVICGKITKERDENLEELLKHGMLHLLGYDHETEESAWDNAAKKINCTF